MQVLGGLYMTNYYNAFTPQQRLYEAQQQYQQYQQPMQQMQGYRVIPVSNEQEATATQVDMYGNPVFFYNKGANEIYIKQFNSVTGLADFQRFQLATMPQNEIKEEKSVIDYTERLNAIESKLDSLLSKGGKNAKSSTD